MNQKDVKDSIKNGAQATADTCVMGAKNWIGPTPKLWRKIRNGFGALGATGVAILSMPKEYQEMIPEWLMQVMVFSGVIGVFLTQFAIESQPTNMVPKAKR